MKCKFILILCTLGTMHAFTAMSQETFPRNDVLDERSGAYALINATLQIDADRRIENGTLLIRDGLIEAVGADVAIPAGYTQIDVSGKMIYPSMIDLHTHYGLPETERTRGRGFGGAEQIMTKTKGAYNANEAIKTHYNASEEFTADSKDSEDWRKNGFGALLTFREDGLSRGTSALVTLNDHSDNEALLATRAGAHYSLTKGSSQQNYPSSMMGYVSLLRQTYLDAAWFGSHEVRPFADKTLEAWVNTQGLPQFFDGGNWLNVLRADKIGDEFGVQFIIKGGGDDYKRIREIKSTGASLIVPVNFPDAYDVSDPLDAEKVSLADMKHWELAPTNPAVLEKNGIDFVLTADGLRNKGDFIKNIRTAIKHGLSKTSALKALTTGPAALVGMGDRLGTLEKGKIANFLVVSGDLFDEKTVIHQNWIQGKAHSFKDLDVADHSGEYTLTVGGDSYELSITGDPGSHKAKIVVNDSTSTEVNASFSNKLVTLGFPDKPKSKDAIRLSGWVTESGFRGTGQLVNGSWVEWQADLTEAEMETDTEDRGNGRRGRGKADGDDTDDAMGDVIFPFIAFGRESLPQAETYLIKNATVWTNEADGIQANTDVLLRDGKIARIGKNLNISGATVIDGRGKHLTAGIIDEHTHIGGGGNDRATNSSMVRIGDQINPDQINIYRTLAGGVTAAQVLHGSANPIGGQSALIKLRWGESPENMKIADAPKFIKFALGENVKRSTNAQSIRYPQSRMGVEQVYVDAFTNAREYEKAWKTYNALPPAEKSMTVAPRRDLVHETMLEILNKERFITCHSYVQSEINMLMKVAEQFDFNINTFTHILEGYKVADKMRDHGAAASTFSDWWNYKWEVRYAIPYNAAIMHKEGVMTAINSDDANSGRRLNQEAAKSIKYGNMSEEDAWKMVTLNPAKMLHLDDRMGSIKVGKDADVVLWTDHPLSIYARAEKTIVDGKIFWDIEEDKQMQVAVREERARLIQKMKDAKKSGGRMQRGASPVHFDFHCDDDYDRGHFNKH